jgi:hypothetical protein
LKPSIVLSNPQEQCVTFYWNEMPSYYVGYRFFEGRPTVTDQPITCYEAQPQSMVVEQPSTGTLVTSQPSNQNWKEEWRIDYSEEHPRVASQLSFRLSSEGIAHVQYAEENSQQQCEWYFQPFPHGIRVWATLTTQVEVQGSYCIPQCLRFTGMYNAKWRQAIAHTPFLSELDMQAMGNANGTLTYARRNNEWFRFPVPYVVFPTCVDGIHSFGSQNDLVDHGLIVRESPSRQIAPAGYWELVAKNTSWEQITSGMYWERTACISNRHPADCVHAWIDFGPLAAGQSRTLRGVVYFVEGTKDDLLALWQSDFNEGTLHDNRNE